MQIQDRISTTYGQRLFYAPPSEPSLAGVQLFRIGVEVIFANQIFAVDMECAGIGELPFDFGELGGEFTELSRVI